MRQNYLFAEYHLSLSINGVTSLVAVPLVKLVFTNLAIRLSGELKLVQQRYL